MRSIRNGFDVETRFTDFDQISLVVYTHTHTHTHTRTHTHTHVHTHTTVDYQVTKKSFKFARTHHLPFFFVSASDGTNVVKVLLHVHVHLCIVYLTAHFLDFIDLGT